MKQPVHLQEGSHLHRSHVFKYSRRQGTMADAMTGQVDETIKNQRSEKLIGIEKNSKKNTRNIL